MSCAQQLAIEHPHLHPDEAGESRKSCFWIAMMCRFLFRTDVSAAPFDAIVDDQLSRREQMPSTPPEFNFGGFLRVKIMNLLELW